MPAWKCRAVLVLAVGDEVSVGDIVDEADDAAWVPGR